MTSAEHHRDAAALRAGTSPYDETGRPTPPHTPEVDVPAARLPRSDRQLAGALAAAFLAAPSWQLEPLRRNAAVVAGPRRRWLGPLVQMVLDAYREAPRDRPRELAAFICSAPPFVQATRAARRRRRPLHVVQHVLSGTAMGRAPWPVTPLNDLAALAELLQTDAEHLAWLCDTSLRQRRAPAGSLHLYRYRWLPRPGRVPRLLEVPAPRLRLAQRIVLDHILGVIPADDAAHGFVAGRSALTGARRHVGAEVVVTLDLRAFFASIESGRIYGILRTAGYPEPVAYALTGLCTTATPVAVISAMPAGGEAAERFHLRQWLRRPHLPQGAPTSPQLANLAAFRLDRRLAGYAEAVGARYTRYADDLTFSSPPDSGAASRPRLRSEALIDAVGRIATAEGFAMNPAKTRVQPRSRRQSVTGIVVNTRTTITRRDYDVLRATLHNALRTGGPAQNRDDHPEFRAQLIGRVAWVESLDPVRGARLRADLDRILF